MDVDSSSDVVGSLHAKANVKAHLENVRLPCLAFIFGDCMAACNIIGDLYRLFD
jgi:hypothetical protein